MAKKTLQEQTIKDNFLFAAAMMEGDNSKAFLSCLLGRDIQRVEISREKSIVYHPEQKGIRLDVFCEDEENTRYNVEMQVLNRKVLKRARYYHGQIDMELLLTGTEYEELPDSFVIFICDFDPFGYGKYCYTVRHSFRELPDTEYEDGSYTIFLSTKGTNDAEVPEELAAFLKYAGAETEASDADYRSELVKQFQETMRRIKEDREMRSRYMLFEEMMRDEFKAGKVKGKAEYINILLKKNRSPEEIAELLDEDIAVVQKVCNNMDTDTEDDWEDAI